MQIIIIFIFAIVVVNKVQVNFPIKNDKKISYKNKQKMEKVQHRQKKNWKMLDHLYEIHEGYKNEIHCIQADRSQDIGK